LEKIANQFIHDESDAVYGDLKYVQSENREKVIRYWKSGEFYQGILQKGWMPPHPTLYLRREVYSKKGLFDLSMKIAADYDMMLRVLLEPSFKINYIPEVFVEMETGGISNGKLSNIIRKSKEDLRGMRKNGIKNVYWVLFRKNLSKIRQFSGE
jgi:glycosyltransferase